MVERPIHSADEGSIPIIPLHSLRVQAVTGVSAELKTVIENHHYSRSVFGVTSSYCFVVKHADAVVGGAIFGKPAGMGVEKKYGPRMTELRRFVLIDECGPNSESRVLSVMLRALRKQGIERVLSYADPAYGHDGIIYRACGFEYLGKTAKRKHIMWKDKKYPDRNIHQVNFPFHLELRVALEDGTATRVVVPGKNIYLKIL